MQWKRRRGKRRRSIARRGRRKEAGQWKGSRALWRHGRAWRRSGVAERDESERRTGWRRAHVWTPDERSRRERSGMSWSEAQCRQWQRCTAPCETMEREREGREEGRRREREGEGEKGERGTTCWPRSSSLSLSLSHCAFFCIQRETPPRSPLESEAAQGARAAPFAARSCCASLRWCAAGELTWTRSTSMPMTSAPRTLKRA